MPINSKKFPYHKTGQWSEKSEFWILNGVRDIVWLLRLLSPISWVSPFFQRSENGRSYSRPHVTDIYVVLTAAFTLIFLVIAASLSVRPVFFGIWALVFIVDSIQYQLRTVLLRPVFHKNYSPYSTERTLIILVTQFLHTIVAFSLIYIVWFPVSFTTDALSLITAIVFSTAAIVANISADVCKTCDATSTTALIPAFEALIGVFYFGLIISTAIGRARQIVALDRIDGSLTLQESAKTTLNALTRYGYDNELDKLATVFDDKLWIVGGWVRNAALGYKYAGDIDCIVPFTVEDINKRLVRLGFKSTRTSFGGHRVYLNDGNYIDVMGTYEYVDSTDILKALRGFNFSANSVAVNYRTKRLLCTSDFEHDMRTRTVRVRSGARYRREGMPIYLFRDYETLINYYDFSPSADSEHEKINAEILELKESVNHLSFDDAMKSASKQIQFLLPEKKQGWIVRGFVRATYLGELQYWDDIDVIVDARNEELLKHLAIVFPNYTLNYFGHPKVFLDKARVDIWTLQEGETIDSAMSKFCHNVDMLAWSVNGASLETTGMNMRELEDRLLTINEQILSNTKSSDIDYCAIKSVYLLIRHQFTVTESVRRLLKRNIAITPFLLKNTIRLVKDLHLCGRICIEDTIGYIRKEVGPSEAISLFESYWKPSK
ncbi:poly A polymerase head domain protein [mine drainage metagenome]|uniref:Poly A polymerase head domain protein n=1 Tax=mine drainage metagenome TaxID=410659 RepID=A0A1J5RE47_9ZZZZ